MLEVCLDSLPADSRTAEVAVLRDLRTALAIRVNAPLDPEWWRDFFDAAYVDAWTAAGAFDHTEEQVEGILDVLDVSAGARILDVPCGFGRISKPLHDHGFEVVGLDISDEQLAMARERNPGPTYIQGDMREPPPGPFDVVLNFFTSFGYFEDIDDDRAALRAWHSVLLEGGVLLMTLQTHRDRLVWQTAAQESDDGASQGTESASRTIERDDDADVSWTMEVDWVAGTQTTEARVGDTVKNFRIRFYAATELVRELHDAGFVDIAVFGGLDRRRLTPQDPLVVRAVK